LKSTNLSAVKSINEELSNEFERLSLTFIRSSVLLSKKDIKRFIRGHQRSLIHLLEKILSSGQNNYFDRKEFILRGCLFLRQLKAEFPKVFKTKMTISRELLSYFESEFANRCLVSRKKLESSSYGQDLQAILIAPLKEAIADYHTISFRRIAYLASLMDLIHAAVEQKIPEKIFFEQLLMINFNKSLFLNYCIEQVNPNLENEELTERLFRLVNTRKELYKIISSRIDSLVPKLPKPLDFIFDYLNQEIIALENLIRITKDFKQSDLLASQFKVSLSVKQLALFMQLQVSCGIILEDKPKIIHQYAIGHYSTKNKIQISEKSFKNGYYIHSAEDIKKIIQKLQEMVIIAEAQL